MTANEYIRQQSGRSMDECTNEEIYAGLLSYVKEKAKEKESIQGKKKLYYISAEFLIGKLLSNNLINLGLYDEVKKELEKIEFNQSFYLKKNKLHFYTEPYSAGPYAAGYIEITVTLP